MGPLAPCLTSRFRPRKGHWSSSFQPAHTCWQRLRCGGRTVENLRAILDLIRKVSSAGCWRSAKEVACHARSSCLLGRGNAQVCSVHKEGGRGSTNQSQQLMLHLGALWTWGHSSCTGRHEGAVSGTLTLAQAKIPLKFFQDFFR